MTLFALLLLATTGQLVLTDELVSLAPGEVKAINLGLRQRPAVVEASFEVIRGDELSLSLLGDPSRRPRFLRMISDRYSGSFRHAVREPGDYQVVLDNRGSDRGHVRTRLRVVLTFDAPGLASPVTLAPAKRTFIVGASLFFLGAMAIWLGSRLRPAIEKRRHDRQPPLF